MTWQDSPVSLDMVVGGFLFFFFFFTLTENDPFYLFVGPLEEPAWLPFFDQVADFCIFDNSTTRQWYSTPHTL